ncbi:MULTISPECIES: hypothetical protein [unclassified Pseudomonas]|uniref:hypothetical protein n=1 Tax=unclassified Pseudomonas TaxID=196821 RepID=UPI0008B5C1D1|nr:MULTISPECIES: hypothetical protein [unclassified Pseudomonas]SES16773.1 hypothetical protein SAMN03159354_05602 [Pseudomonas sp. NFPP19]
MRFYSWVLGIILLLLGSYTFADPVRQECLGRLTFDAPENIEWSTFAADEELISNGGGHIFTDHVSAKGDYVSYDYDGLTIRISRVVMREDFDVQRNAIIRQSEEYQRELIKDLSLLNRMLEKMLKTRDFKDEVVVNHKESIAQVEHDIPLAKIHEFDLGIPDAHILGGKDLPFQVLLWRKQRIYYFYMSKPDKNSSQRIKDLIARFEPRDLYQIPKGPGICMPYGFIHDDGKPGFEVKNSLRFTRTPNVIMSMINASRAHPDAKPTTGIYTTDLYPGYDAKKWTKSKLLQKFYLGDKATLLEGWRLDPRPDSGERERAWFAMAHTGGLARPLLAVHMITFQKGKDGLAEHTPPPEEVIPRFLKLTHSIRQHE